MKERIIRIPLFNTTFSHTKRVSRSVKACKLQHDKSFRFSNLFFETIHTAWCMYVAYTEVMVVPSQCWRFSSSNQRGPFSTTIIILRFSHLKGLSSTIVTWNFHTDFAIKILISAHARDCPMQPVGPTLKGWLADKVSLAYFSSRWSIGSHLSGANVHGSAFVDWTLIESLEAKPRLISDHNWSWTMGLDASLWRHPTRVVVVATQR